MYQLEVKAVLVKHCFSPKDNWVVNVDVDAMERGKGGNHPPDKQGRAKEAEDRLKEIGAKIVSHPEYGRTDIVAEHKTHGRVIIEVEGDSSKQPEQAMYSALGQLLLSMKDLTGNISYALAVPDSKKWEQHLKKIPAGVKERLKLRLYLVSKENVRNI